MNETVQVSPANPNGWNEWSRHVLSELKRLNDAYEAIDGKLNRVRTDIAVLKVKSGVWGFMAGTVPGLTVVLYIWLKGT